MASVDQINKLNGYAKAFKTLDRKPILRAQLGTASLEVEFAPMLDYLTEKIAFASELSENVHNGVVTGLNNNIQALVELIQNQANAPSDAAYVSQRESFLTGVKQKTEDIKQYWPPFITAAIESRGFLQDEGIRKEYQKTIDQMEQKSKEALETVEKQSKKVLEEAKKLAEEIEQRARRTAAHISVEDAQKVFRDAKKPLLRQVILWSCLTAAGIAGFLIVAIYFYTAPLFDEKTTITENVKWIFVYKSVLRFIILTVIGAITTFCLKMFRASMHMYHHNLHRQRITNSMAAFVESAVTPEQRDLILSHLVDAIAAFGNCGLIQNEDDSMPLPKMTIDNITRTISSATGK